MIKNEISEVLNKRQEMQKKNALRTRSEDRIGRYLYHFMAKPKCQKGSISPSSQTFLKDLLRYDFRYSEKLEF